MQVTPIRDQVVIEINRKEAEEQVSDGGIIMGTTQPQERPNSGKLIAVGEEVNEYLVVGLEVMFGQNARGETYKDMGQEYVVMKEEYVIGIINR